jgi:hypothetical protein
MGNFSRDTFNQTKNYVAVRLEQGVPLVDADWNELEDVTRTEAYLSAAVLGGNTVATRANFGLIGGSNDLTLLPGSGIVSGRPVRLWSTLRYATQRYRDAATAAHDGVSAVPDLTTPPGNRTDIVYLDAFDREVDSTEDTSLVNGAIGLQTSVRLKRELVLRVAQGLPFLPVAPSGHWFLPLALLNRTNQAQITPAMVQDIKPYPEVFGPREATFAPSFQTTAIPPTTFDPWVMSRRPGPSVALSAMRQAGKVALGVLPLHLPAQARLLQLRVRGITSSQLDLKLVRTFQWSGDGGTLVEDSVLASAAPFDRQLSIPQTGSHIVDNVSYSYSLYAFCFSNATTSEIYGVTIRYDR